MKKTILICLVASFLNAYDLDPDHLYDRDLKVLEKFDSSLYRLATEEINTKKMSMIYAYILANKSRTYTTNPLVLRAEAKIYNKNIDYADISTKYQRYGLSVEYIILDTKQRNEIRNRILDDDNKILKMLEEYNHDLADFEAEKKLLRYKNFVQIRAKAQEKTGIINKEDRIKIIDDIMSARNKIKILTDKIEIDRLKILNLVVPSARAKLLDMIK